MVLALFAGLLISIRIAKWHGIKKDVIYDLFFYLIIGGFIGARLFYVLYNVNYFWQNPVDIIKIWQGGIAIHGALIFGILVLWWFARKHKFDFWKLSAIIAPGVALGQAIGRWGNYFNQELFGLPTDLPWGIPIALANRPEVFENFEYFHPTFLYESIGSLIVFIILLILHYYAVKRKKYLIFNIKYSIFITLDYVLLYSILRFFIEFIRIDPTAGNIFGMRATQGLSLAIIITSIIICVTAVFKDKKLT
jgi:phosphatidylglycerol:prolipoprotein diacylglycerol transferase